MKLKSLIRKSLAKVPTHLSGQDRRFAESVSDNLDVLTGRRGNLIDRAVTFRDLLDTGLLRKASGLLTDGGVVDVVGGDPNDPDGGVVDQPTQPTNLTASGGFGRIFLNWNLPPYRGHSRIQIFRHTSDSLSAAQANGVYYEYFGDAHFWNDVGLSSGTTYYYWVRAVNRLGVTSAFNSSTGTSATTAIDYLYVSGLIDDILDDDVSNLGLNTAIEALSDEIDDIDVDITPLENFVGYSSTYSGNSLIVRMGDVETVAGNAATSAQLQTESTTRANADSALSSQITTLNTTVNNPTTGLAATYAGLQTEITTRANEDSALSTSITSLDSVVNDSSTGLAATRSQLQTEQTTRANADSAMASSITTLQSDVSSNQAQIQTEATTRANADSALATRTTTLESSVNNPTTGLSATYAGLQTEQTVRANADSALSSSVTTLTSTVNGYSASIQTNASSINGIEAKYSVKIDTNGNVAGFGVISNSNTGVPTSGTGSAFIVAADRFAIATDADASATENSVVGANYPFKVFTTTHYVTDEDGNQAYDDDGTAITIPAGVYIKDAFIHNGQITTANIKYGTITDANIGSLDAGKIRSGQIQIDNQNNFAIFQGKTQYLGGKIVGNYYSNNNGFFLGNVNGSAVLNIGNGTDYVKWNGSDLEITGASIKTASIDSLQLAGNAVTIPEGATTTATTTALTPSVWTSGASVTVYWATGPNDLVPAAWLANAYFNLPDNGSNSSIRRACNIRILITGTYTSGGSWSLTGRGLASIAPEERFPAVLISSTEYPTGTNVASGITFTVQAMIEHPNGSGASGSERHKLKGTTGITVLGTKR